MNHTLDTAALKKRILEAGSITREEVLALAAHPDKEAVYTLANDIREHFKGKKLGTCCIVNARSGICSEDCKWCSQSVFHTTGVARYDIIDREEAVESARVNESYGVNRYSLVTASRAFPKKSVEEACSIYREIRKKGMKKIGFCASMGLLDLERLQMLKNAGVEHYHINLETSRRYFPQMVTRHTFDDKLEVMAKARKAGLKICSGGIIGLGETMEDRIDMAMELARQGVDSIPVNILNPIEGTPLEGTPPLTDQEILVSLALFRIINPRADIRFAGGRMLIRHLVEKAFQSGMNALMVGDLLTTVGSKVEEDMELVEKMGFERI